MIKHSRYYNDILLGEVINTNKTSVRIIWVLVEIRTWDVSITNPESYLHINALNICSLASFFR
jgi:hypothetical protein